MAQQTAVDWLLLKLKEYVNTVSIDTNSYSIRIPKVEMVNIIEQAKAIEKEQLINAIDSQYNYDKWTKELPTLGEQYYNETYKK